MDKKDMRKDQWIEDGTETRQLYICPTCGRKTSDKSDYRCDICKAIICRNCKKTIEIESFYNTKYYCPTHFKKMKKGLSLLRKFIKKIERL